MSQGNKNYLAQLQLLCFRHMIRSDASSIVKKYGAKIHGRTVASKCLMFILFFREIA